MNDSNTSDSPFIKPFPPYGVLVDTHFKANLKNVLKEIAELNNADVLNEPLEVLEKRFIDKAHVEPLTLHIKDRYTEEEKGIQDKTGRVQATLYIIAIPYEGNPDLWGLTPKTTSLGVPPKIEVLDDRIRLQLVETEADSPREDLFKRRLEYITVNSRNMAKTVMDYNKESEKNIKHRLLKKQNLAQKSKRTMASFGIPLKPRPTPDPYIIPDEQKKLTLPTASKLKGESDPTLALENYERVLTFLRSMSVAIERNPRLFPTLGEELIRDLFLIMLNGYYEGKATGETFNGKGKTDILIRVGNENVFVSECKIWHGPKEFNEAIDQLLGYVTWRDTKCALLIFNKNQNSSRVYHKMHEVMVGRNEHMETKSYDSSDASEDCRYIFAKESDRDRKFIITTMMFNMSQ